MDNSTQSCTAKTFQHSYFKWYELIWDIAKSGFKSQVYDLLKLMISFNAIFIAIDYYRAQVIFNNPKAFVLSALLSIVISSISSYKKYSQRIPFPLRNEENKIISIVIRKDRLWQFKLAHALMLNRITSVEKRIDDLQSRRQPVVVKKYLKVREYLDWLRARPSCVMSMTESAKKIIIDDFIDAVESLKTDEIKLDELVHAANLVSYLYEKIYEYQVMSHEIEIDDECKLIHDIQNKFTDPIRNGVMEFIDKLSWQINTMNRDDNFISIEFAFNAIERMDEFNEEYKRLIKIQNGS